MQRTAPLRYLLILRDLVERELRGRYKQSLLGPVWIVLAPLLLLAPLAIVFRVFVPLVGDVSFTAFVYTGLLPWLFFAESVRTGTESMVTNAPLIRRIAFARSLLPLAMVGTRAVEFILVGAFTITPGMFLGLFRFTPALLALPVLFTLLAAFAAGLALMTSALFVFYRDIRHLVHVLLVTWMYATPIVYAPEMLPGAARAFLMLNPLSWFLAAGRRILLEGRLPHPLELLVLASWSAGSLVLGLMVFRFYRRDIADVV